MDKNNQEKCPRCGSVFSCCTKGKCWCSDVEVPASVLKQLKSKYDTCLCPDCLKELASNPSRLQKS